MCWTVCTRHCDLAVGLGHSHLKGQAHTGGLQLSRQLRPTIKGRSERLKSFPYPPQHVLINAPFIRLFCILLPFGMLKGFDTLHRVYLLIPFSVMNSWK